MIITVILMTDYLLEGHHLMYHSLVYLEYDTWKKASIILLVLLTHKYGSWIFSLSLLSVYKLDEEYNYDLIDLKYEQHNHLIKQSSLNQYCLLLTRSIRWLHQAVFILMTMEKHSLWFGMLYKHANQYLLILKQVDSSLSTKLI